MLAVAAISLHDSYIVIGLQYNSTEEQCSYGKISSNYINVFSFAPYITIRIRTSLSVVQPYKSLGSGPCKCQGANVYVGVCSLLYEKALTTRVVCIEPSRIKILYNR